MRCWWPPTPTIQTRACVGACAILGTWCAQVVVVVVVVVVVMVVVVVVVVAVAVVE